MKIEELIGSRIAEARNARGMSQAELGKHIARWLKADWTRQVVWAAEKGQRGFTGAELAVFAHVLDIPIGRLFTPTLNVQEVEMPSGDVLSRDALTEAALPSDPVREVLHDMQAALADLVTSQEAARNRQRKAANDLDAAMDRAGSLAVQLEQAMELAREE